MLKAVLFDLDGTLLPIDENEFVKGYFKLLCKKLAPLGYEPNMLVDTFLAGTKLMINNDGKKTNEQVFWEIFKEKYGEEKLKDKNIINTFYLNEFKKVKEFCKDNELACEIIKTAKNCGLKVILASNPVFPVNGMITRLNFLGLNKSDFDYITSYENSHFAKPNPKFYSEILKANNLNANEVIYFANSEKDDFMPAESVGIRTFLIEDFGKGLDDKQERIFLDEVSEIIFNLSKRK